MIIKPFIDRREELSFLEEKYNSNSFEFVLVYGRRRIGKTRLIKEFIKDKDALYFLCENKPLAKNLEKFSKIISEELGLPVKIENLKDLFKILKNHCKKRIVVFDEFSYLIKQDKYITSDLQVALDEILKDSNIMLVILGSHVSLMERHLLSYSSPIYGRATGILRLSEFSFPILAEWFPKTNAKDLVKLYSVVGGVPRYLEFFNGSDIDNEIKNNFFNKNSFLVYEAYQLLSEELKNVSIYMAILEALSLGKRSITEIAGYVYMKPNELSPYLAILSNLGFIRKKKNVLKTMKKSLYEISDPYMDFWFSFVSPYYEEITSGFHDNAILNFEKNFNTYLGRRFEKVCEQLVRLGIFGFKKQFKIGPYWDKNVEIDLLGLNEDSKELLAVECKWKENVDPKRICRSLLDKLDYVNWQKDKRKEYLAIFAKSFKEKITEFNGHRVFCYDLKDIEDFVKRQD